MDEAQRRAAAVSIVRAAADNADGTQVSVSAELLRYVVAALDAKDDHCPDAGHCGLICPKHRVVHSPAEVERYRSCRSRFAIPECPDCRAPLVRLCVLQRRESTDEIARLKKMLEEAAAWNRARARPEADMREETERRGEAGAAARCSWLDCREHHPERVVPHGIAEQLDADLTQLSRVVDRNAASHEREVGEALRQVGVVADQQRDLTRRLERIEAQPLIPADIMIRVGALEQRMPAEGFAEAIAKAVREGARDLGRRIAALEAKGAARGATEDRPRASAQEVFETCRRLGDEPPLALDVDLEEARALHRLVRAMNDGECPNCSRLVPHPMTTATIGRYCCLACGFTIEADETSDIIRGFKPAMQGALNVLAKWRERRRAGSEKARHG